MESRCPAFYPAPLRDPALAHDGELIRRSVAGDADAFNALFQRHRPGLLGFLLRWLRSREDAEDAVVTTLTKAWTARATFRGASGKAWLYTIAARVALDTARRRPAPAEALEDSPEAALLGMADDADPMLQVTASETDAELQRAVHDALLRLTGDERELVERFYFAGQGYEEIGDALGIARSEGRGRLHRVRERIRRELTAPGDGSKKLQRNRRADCCRPGVMGSDKQLV